VTATYAAFKTTLFPGTLMYFSTRPCKTTFCTHYKGMAQKYDEILGSPAWRGIRSEKCDNHPVLLNTLWMFLQK